MDITECLSVSYDCTCFFSRSVGMALHPYFATPSSPSLFFSFFYSIPLFLSLSLSLFVSHSPSLTLSPPLSNTPVFKSVLLNTILALYTAIRESQAIRIPHDTIIPFVT